MQNNLAPVFLLLFSVIISACQAAPGKAIVAPPATATLSPSATPVRVFDGQRAWQDVADQVKMGPRIPGSSAHQQLIDWAVNEFKKAGWSVEVQQASLMEHPIRNIVARRGTNPAAIILGAHYDTRMVADQDPDPAKRKEPVPGANDGASGVAVLLELARTLPPDRSSDIALVLFDTEDQGSLPGWDWILGSRAYAQSLSSPPQAVVVIDMIGDANLDIFQEKNSTLALTKSIWSAAGQLGYAQFINQMKYSMLDDHTPFLEKGFPAVDLIDFDYPYWHTTSDTPDKVSAASLKAVGDVLIKWILTR
jgi:Zn-dependent M28 family amino/carboxypeptidase